jgi:BirA family transcriptional regulator, biotin operon repressor / biotin---[acetyl-CoA-carboxylase] ligase
MALDCEQIRRRFPERRIYWRPSTVSTMIEAAELAASGCKHGTVVGADQQTGGFGRFGRPWHSAPDTGIYMSIVLRPRVIENVAPVTLALGLAVVESIRKSTAIVCDLRWPNDVLAGGKKCCGILARYEPPAVIGGIGINVNQSSFPAEIADLATSLRMVSGRMHSREQIVIELLPAIDTYCAILEQEGRDPILRMFSEASSYVSGRRVMVDEGDSHLEGVTDGLNSHGFLLLRDDQGKQHQILAGGVRPCS